MKYIVEYGIPGGINGANTVEDLCRYLNSDPHPDHKLASSNLKDNGMVLMVWESDDCQAEHDRSILINACKNAYRKHSLDDSDIGWTELSETLAATLAEVLGDKEFARWSEEVAREKNG